MGLNGVTELWVSEIVVLTFVAAGNGAGEATDCNIIIGKKSAAVRTASDESGG